MYKPEQRGRNNPQQAPVPNHTVDIDYRIIYDAMESMDLHATNTVIEEPFDKG